MDTAQFEYVTIIGSSFDEVAKECRAQRLTEQDFSIVSPISWHQLTVAGTDGASSGLNGQSVVTATFARRS